MDEMRIKGPFFERILASVIKKYLYKNFKIKVTSITLNGLDISLSKTTTAKAEIEIKLDENNTNILKDKIVEVF